MTPLPPVRRLGAAGFAGTSPKMTVAEAKGLTRLAVANSTSAQGADAAAYLGCRGTKRPDEAPQRTGRRRLKWPTRFVLGAGEPAHEGGCGWRWDRRARGRERAAAVRLGQPSVLERSARSAATEGRTVHIRQRISGLGLRSASERPSVRSAPTPRRTSKSGIRTAERAVAGDGSPQPPARICALSTVPSYTRVLLASLTPGTVHWGQRVAAVTNGCVKTEAAEDGDLTTGADLIIGADGIRSRVRASLPRSRPTQAQRIRRVARHHALDQYTSKPGVRHGALANGSEWSRLQGRARCIGSASWPAALQHRNGPRSARRDSRQRFGSWHEPISRIDRGHGAPRR